jgi:hypothetical protein
LTDNEQSKDEMNDLLDYKSLDSKKTIEENENFSIRQGGDINDNKKMPKTDNDYLSQSNAGFRELPVLDHTINNDSTPSNSD